MTLTLGSLVDMKGAIRVTGSPKLGVLDVSTLEVCAGIEIVDLGIKTLDRVLVVYVGTEGEEADWVFARHEATSYDAGGWVPVNRLVALHNVPMCGASCT